MTEDDLFDERRARWEARHRGRSVTAPAPMWWPWPLARLTLDDGDPDTGLVVVGVEPFLWPDETSEQAGRPYAKLVRQPAGDPPYSFGWAGLAWRSAAQIAVDEAERDPVGRVFAHGWREGPWQWTVFVCGIRPLTRPEVDRIRDRLVGEYAFPQDAGELRPWG